jgi:hypothetical protein
VNREIDIGVVRFFAAGSADDLAAKMVDMLVTPPKMPSKEETCARLTLRQQEFGKFLLGILSMAAKGDFT